MIVSNEDLRVRLDANLKRKLDEVIEARGQTQQRAVSNLVAWFVAQDPLVQLMVTGAIPPEQQQDVARLLLRRLAGEPEPDAGPLVIGTPAPRKGPAESRGGRPGRGR